MTFSPTLQPLFRVDHRKGYMATTEQQYPGVPSVMGDAVREFVSYGFLFGLGVLVYTLPALVIALAGLPPLTSYILASAAMLTIMVTGRFVRDDDSDLSVPEEYEDMTALQSLLLVSVFYALVGGALSAMFLWAAFISALVTYVLGMPTVGLAIALVYPAFDRWASHKVPTFSVVYVVGMVIAHVLIALFEAYNLSRDLVESARDQSAALY